jgi:hypothetical protein
MLCNITLPFWNYARDANGDRGWMSQFEWNGYPLRARAAGALAMLVGFHD